jgi:acyl-coenzyme A thioesterase PaaI-like protein
MDLRPENLRAVIETGIPFLRKVAVKLEGVEPGRMRLRFPRDPTNDNYVGVTHAGAIFTFGETCAGVAAGAALDLTRIRLLARRAVIDYLRPVRGDLSSTVEIPREHLTAAEGAIEREGKAVLPVKVTMVDAAGETAAEMTVEYHLRKVA